MSFESKSQFLFSKKTEIWLNSYNNFKSLLPISDMYFNISYNSSCFYLSLDIKDEINSIIKSIRDLVS